MIYAVYNGEAMDGMSSLGPRALSEKAGLIFSKDFANLC